jgi:hypothetical protein
MRKEGLKKPGLRQIEIDYLSKKHMTQEITPNF